MTYWSLDPATKTLKHVGLLNTKFYEDKFTGPHLNDDGSLANVGYNNDIAFDTEGNMNVYLALPSDSGNAYRYTIAASEVEAAVAADNKYRQLNAVKEGPIEQPVVQNNAGQKLAPGITGMGMSYDNVIYFNDSAGLFKVVKNDDGTYTTSLEYKHEGPAYLWGDGASRPVEKEEPVVPEEPKQPEDPKQPEEPKQPESPKKPMASKKTKAPKTGDESNTGAVAAVAAVAGLGALALARRKED